MFTGLLEIALGVSLLVALILRNRPRVAKWFVWAGVAGLVVLAAFGDLSISGRFLCGGGALLIGGLQVASQVVEPAPARRSRRGGRP